MFAKYMVMTQGFENVVEKGEVIGFQMKVRITYYRGVCLALIAGFHLSVDGERFSPEQLRFTVKGGGTYTMKEMESEEKVRWEFDEPATLTVLKPGGLKPGLHEVDFTEIIKPAYIPGPGFIEQTKRNITLVA